MNALPPSLFDPFYKDTPGEALIDTVEAPEDRVEVYANLLCESEYSTATAEHGLYAYARVLAKREAMGELCYEDVVEQFYPKTYLMRMREIPPEVTFE